MYILLYTAQRQLSGNFRIYSISNLRGLEEIIRHSLRKLILLCPLADLLKVAALVLRVEVDEGFGVFGVNPNLTQDSHVHAAHQLLADDIETMSCLD